MFENWRQPHFFLYEGQPQYYEIGRKSQFLGKSKTASIFFKIKDNLIFINVKQLHSKAHTSNQPDQHNKLK
jgi:hypothetical protein